MFIVVAMATRSTRETLIGRFTTLPVICVDVMNINGGL